MRSLGEQGLARERVEKDKSLFKGKEITGKTLAIIGLGHIGASTARDASSLGMNIVGYDPGLSIASALKLPREIQLADSIASAVSRADYISLNIPYIKGTPEEGGTHGIIGKDVISHFKDDAVLLNFARGELVDSPAMKEFLDRADGRYVSDFPDDELWDHDKAVILPHLGASTEEAEDSAAAMAADTIREYIETGTIRNSVNFPETSLPTRPDKTIRVTVVNNNVPGVLARITDAFARANINIIQQINQSRGDIAYNVLDIDPHTQDGGMISLKVLQKDVTMIDGVLSSRILFGTPGIGYARNIGGQYTV
jgi:D-3-phosphoglycerate dehydrogenase